MTKPLLAAGRRQAAIDISASSRGRLAPGKALALASARTLVAAVASLACASASYAATANTGPEGRVTKEMAVFTDRGISPARARQALDVQDKVGQADLPSKLEVALGKAYAGVWFEPASASFHVGVTSATTRRTAQRIVANVDLAAVVAYTSVRSPWGALLATQTQWNKRLSRLLESGEATTGLDPQRNAVSVKLSSSVSSRERAALRRDAASAGVNVLVTVVPGPGLRIEPLAKCKAPFESGKAYCEKTLVSGVGIRTPEICTAGPMLIVGTETFMLTAGHCFGSKSPSTGKPIAEKVTSEYPTGGGQKEIGKEGIWFENKERDIAEVKIAAGSAFTEALPIPVPALMAEWVASAENPHTVSGHETNVKGQANCHEGQTSGEQCGTIEALNVTAAGTEHLVEDTACGEKGDSGGPFFLRQATTKNILMQGVLVAGNVVKKCSEGEKTTFYEPLLDLAGAAGFGVFSTFPGQKLLTTANESRVEGPLYSVNGKSLKAGETRLLLASAKEKFTIASASITIECTGINLPEAARMQIIGGAAKSGGSSNEAIEFTTCTQSGNGASCTISSSKFTSASLVNTLGYSSSTRGGPVLVLFLPEVGSTFATVKFSGLCTLLTASLTGSVIGVAQVAGTPVTVGGGTETLHGEVNFTEPAKTIWTESSGSLKETKAKLELAGLSAKFTGIALLLVDEGGSPVNWGIFS